MSVSHYCNEMKEKTDNFLGLTVKTVKVIYCFGSDHIHCSD